MSETRDPSTDQPLPVPNDHPAVHDLVIADVKARKALGVRKYQTALQPHNGRNMLRDAYEEVLDLAAYLRGALAEQEEPGDEGARLAVRAAAVDGIRGRYALARMAGESAGDAGQGWDEAKIAAIVRSWQDIPTLLAMLGGQR